MSVPQNLSDEKLQALSASGNSEAEELLIRRYTRVVKALARPYFLTGASSEDLIQEGMIGLLSALRSYDPHGGASFKTRMGYSVHAYAYREFLTDREQVNMNGFMAAAKLPGKLLAARWRRQYPLQ